jgi:hypothetical protein
MSIPLAIGLFGFGYVLGLCVGFVVGNLEMDTWRKGGAE